MGTQSSSPATAPSTRQPGEPPLELALSTLPTRGSTRAGAVATEGAPGAATRREQTPGSSLATTIPLATASSDSLEALELLPSLTAFLAVPVVKELSNILIAIKCISES